MLGHDILRDAIDYVNAVTGGSLAGASEPNPNT
jgi:hypothetical protein